MGIRLDATRAAATARHVVGNPDRVAEQVRRRILVIRAGDGR